MLKLRYSQSIVAVGLFLMTAFMLSADTFNSIWEDQWHHTRTLADMFKGVVIALLHVATFVFAFRIANNKNLISIKQVIKKGVIFFIGVGFLAAFLEYRLYSYTLLGEEKMGLMFTPIAFIVLPITGLALGIFYYVLIKKEKLGYFLSVFLCFAVIVSISLISDWDSDCPVHGRYSRMDCIENKAIATKDYSVCKKLSGDEYPEICLTGIARKLKNPSIYSCASDRIRETKYSCLNDFLR